MAEPTLCAFLTKLLCAHGGRLLLPALRSHVELPEARVRAALLQAGPGRFLLHDVAPGSRSPEAEAAAGLGGSAGGGPSVCRVVAVSSARLCARYQRGRCRACDQLHLCRRHVLGRCPHRDCWSTCALSHDIHTPANIQVLKKHGIFGLNEEQLRILLLQNDPFLLPEICLFYNGGESQAGSCSLGQRCGRLHVCRAFVRGECTQRHCPRSHQLLHAAPLRQLEEQGLSVPSLVNFQIIAADRHRRLHRLPNSRGDSVGPPESPQGRLTSEGAPQTGAARAGLPLPLPFPAQPATVTRRPRTGGP